MTAKKLTRREFLLMSATGIAGLGLAACAPAATQDCGSHFSTGRNEPTRCCCHAYAHPHPGRDSDIRSDRHGHFQ